MTTLQILIIILYFGLSCSMLVSWFAIEAAFRSGRLKFIFAWYDFWIGVFIDTKKKKVYIFPVPMFGIVFYYNLENI